MDWNLEKPKKPSKKFLLTAPFDKICRTCLSLQVEEEMFSIFDAACESIKLYEIFRDYVSVQVQENDGLPQHVCKSCMAVLLQLYMFMQQSEQSDLLLQEVINEHDKNLVSPIITKVSAVSEATQIGSQEAQETENIQTIVICRSSETEYPFLDTNQKEANFTNIYVDDKTYTLSPESDQFNSVDIKNELEPDFCIKQECSKQNDGVNNLYTTSQSARWTPTLLYSCSYCKESFETFNELKQHRKDVKHPRPRNHLCGQCNKAFISSWHLQQHMATHAKEIQFSCQNSDFKPEQDEQNLKNNLSKHCKSLVRSSKRRNTIYSCKKCNEIFASHSELKIHRKQEKHKQQCNHVCPKCYIPAKTLHNLKQHMKTHSSEPELNSFIIQDDQNVKNESLKNTTCIEEASVDKRSPSVNSVSNSLIDSTLHNQNLLNDDSSKSSPTCKQCNKSFDSYNELKLHWKQVKHPQPRRHVCPECKKSFISNSKLQQHRRTHTKEKPYSCYICQMHFSASCSLRRHMMQHTGERPHVCEFCGKGFIQAECLVEHRRLHTGETPFKCSYCSRYFRYRVTYKAHLERHFITDTPAGGNKKSFHQCDTCQRKFGTKAILKTHMLTHGEKNFLCSQCGKGFAIKGGLISHMKVHTGDKPYVCKECNKAFSQRGVLKSHARIHSGEKPFACRLCPKAFTLSHHLVYHMRTHSKEKPFKCSYCSKLFAFKASLTVHVRIHTGETPFVCNVCGKGFYHSNNMKKHKKVHEKLNKSTVSEINASQQDQTLS